MIEPADRMRSIPPYVFAELGRRITGLREAGHDVIRMDMGSPDLPPTPDTVTALIQSAENPNHHGYAPFGGTEGYRRAVAAHYETRFGVSFDPRTEVLGLIGSKEGLFHIAQAFVNPGDVVLVPDPGYPVYSSSALFAGGEVVTMPLREQNDYLPDFSALGEDVLERAKLMWLNYPNNPTGATADLSFFEHAVELASKHGILLCHDAPYTEVCYEGYVAPSLMQVAAARETAVEFNSLSKSHNMAGWRLGMAVGNADVLEALYTLKSQMDTSHFRAVLDAGEYALRADQSWIQTRNAVYQERRDVIVDAVRQAGLSATPPRAALYVWAGLPTGVHSSDAYCRAMLDDIYVSITPGVAFGAAGEGYVRISLGTPTELVRQAMERVAGWRYSGD
jgi:LL-diaminopimelate aminotransferase